MRDKETPEYISSKKHDKDALYALLSYEYGVPLVPQSKFDSIWNITNIGDALIFPHGFDKEYEENNRIRSEVMQKYEKIKQEFMDKLYLCDEAQEALDLINSI
jgi:hypothetical protein